ncbi:MAG: Eco57I restriction-modification methylase domain-containing protein, partial [Anaerolineae bacterium]
MQKRHKDLLRTLVKELRHILAGHEDKAGAWQRGDLDRELERLGFAPDGAITPIDALRNPTPEEVRAYRVAEVQLAPLPQEQRPPARAELIERAAYSWINRLLALRAMEARDLIDETLRQNPAYDGVSEALYILRHQAPARTTGADAGWWAVIDDACDVLSPSKGARQAGALPGLFDPADPAVALRPSASALLRCIALVGGDVNGFSLEQSDAAFADPDAIGWAYQFYQEEAKARVYAKLGSGGKAETRAEIAAVTQLFTEPYMVKWLLQNSLGRSYHEAYPDTALPATWEYYIDRSKIEGLDENLQLSTFNFQLSNLTVMDPCMGSGHFLREAFDMLVAMYREQHPAQDAREIADRILRDHLYGIDLDPRAAQLAALTLYLRAWELVRDEQRRRGEYGAVAYRPPAMNLATTPSGLDEGALERHLQRHPEDRIFKPLLEGIFAALEQAHILGSLLRPGEHLDEALAAFEKPGTLPLGLDADDAALRRTLTELAKHDPAELKRLLLDRVAQSFAAEAGSADVSAALFGREAEQGVRLLQLLDRHYTVVVTNPPYMNSGSMGQQLKAFVADHYKPGRRDLYAAFISRCLRLSCYMGRVAMVTQQGWMFLRTFSAFRALPEAKLASVQDKVGRGLLRESMIETLAHLG